MGAKRYVEILADLHTITYCDAALLTGTQSASDVHSHHLQAGEVLKS